MVERTLAEAPAAAAPMPLPEVRDAAAGNLQWAWRNDRFEIFSFRGNEPFDPNQATAANDSATVRAQIARPMAEALRMKERPSATGPCKGSSRGGPRKEPLGGVCHGVCRSVCMYMCFINTFFFLCFPAM